MAATQCPPDALELTAPTIISDRVCAASMEMLYIVTEMSLVLRFLFAETLSCNNHQLPNSTTTCTCPDDGICNSCAVQVNEEMARQDKFCCLTSR